eukprot:1119215-Pelagomonas_calceolata.AAC.6
MKSIRGVHQRSHESSHEVYPIQKANKRSHDISLSTSAFFAGRLSTTRVMNTATSHKPACVHPDKCAAHARTVTSMLWFMRALCAHTKCVVTHARTNNDEGVVTHARTVTNVLVSAQRPLV